jgi:hypothetical protein
MGACGAAHSDRQEIIMSFRHRVMLHGATLALSGLLISAQAHAQAQNQAQTQMKEPDRTTGSAPRDEPALPQAPVGHRQPRASDIPASVPRDPSDEWLERINRSLDRKLQICRGC